MTETRMDVPEWNNKVDEWLKSQGDKAGEERRAEWPPDKLGLRGGIEDKIATPDRIGDYAHMMGDPNPLWSNQDYARETRWGAIIAPPTFENTIGTPFDYYEIYKLPGTFTIMDAGISRDYFTVIRPLDEFTATDIYKGVSEIPEALKPYRRFIQQIERTYYNQRHEKVAVVIRDTAIIADAPGNKYNLFRELYGGIKRPRYSRADLAEIYQSYEDEFAGKYRRGDDPRYWEDTQEGDNIHSLIFGPLGDADSQYIFRTGHGRSFALKWATIKHVLDRAVVDPETGEYMYFLEQYFSDRMAREVGFPHAVGVAMQNEVCVVHAITNWMGDDGFIRKFDLRHEGMNFQGDVSRVNGTVKRKYTDKNKHLVDIEAQSECQDGRLLIKGVVTVQLPSKGNMYIKLS